MEVFRLEEQAHLQASVRASNDRDRERCAGVALWLSDVLSGKLAAAYIRDARIKLDQPLPEDAVMPGGDAAGSDYMLDDNNEHQERNPEDAH